MNSAIAESEVDVLLVSPERLNNPSFRYGVLLRLAATTGLLVDDEAHCITQAATESSTEIRQRVESATPFRGQSHILIYGADRMLISGRKEALAHRQWGELAREARSGG